MPLLSLALVGCGLGGPALPEMGPVDLPAAFSATLVVEGRETSERSSATAGLTKARSAHVDQALGWSVPRGPLADEVQHERSLVYIAMDRDPPAQLDAPSLSRVDGREALSWTVDAGETVFFGTSLDCPGGPRVALTTYGTAGHPVEQVHQATLATLRCGATAR
ncbi:MAG: hypothetical protein H6742_00525 [Alphaproteobacteria bacterium]|nr:hypothetical protein [Alphaproteobacteria bacterium]